MNKKIILFSHHKVDELTIDRFNLVKRLNPTWDVVSVGFNGYDLLPNSLFVNREIYPKNKELVEVDNLHNEDWSNPDFFLYSGYSEFSNYDEYFLYEYDTISNVGIEEFFNTDVDFFGNGIRSPADEEWWWVKQYRKLNPNNYKFNNLHSYGQSTCIYFKNHILKKCTEEILKNKSLYDNMLSEIRGGTLVSQFTTLKMGRSDIEKYISWTPSDINLDMKIPHFYHPLK
jgi:hypothetical protein